MRDCIQFGLRERRGSPVKSLEADWFEADRIAQAKGLY